MKSILMCEGTLNWVKFYEEKHVHISCFSMSVYIMWFFDVRGTMSSLW